METKHSSGPWSFHRGGFEDRIVIASESAGYKIAATLGPADSLDVANARLIAAAPELLAIALDAFASAASRLAINPNDASTRELMKAARAAIAKATGETP
jgi:hypothetical protein